MAAPIEASGDLSSRANSSAQGGKIGSSFINNSSGSGIGLVKMLALAGIGLIIWRLVR